MRFDRPDILRRDVVGLVVSTLQRLSSGPCQVEDAAVVTFMLNRKKPLARVRPGGPDAFEITPDGRQWLAAAVPQSPGAKPQKQGVLFLSVMLPRTNREVARIGEISPLPRNYQSSADAL
jgi:hypothetical protein